MSTYRILALMFAIASWLVPGSVLAQTATPPALRLPDTVQPGHYAAELTIRPDETSFRGSIDIALEVIKPTNVIWLNARYLTVEVARIDGAGVSATATIIPGGEDFVGLQFDHALTIGSAGLHLEYKGEINRKDTSGVFALKEGADWYAFTQFEPTRA